MTFETGFSKVSFSDCLPSHDGAKQKPEAMQAILFNFSSLLCPTVLISDIFVWDKRKFGEFQHQLDLEEQEDSLLVLMLLLLAAILSENTIFLGNQVQLYLRQQMSRICKAYMVTTYR